VSGQISHVTVLSTVAVFPQTSTAINVLVCDRLHVPITGPVIDVIVGVPHASVAVAVPNAASISAAFGLHAKVFVVPVAVIVGAIRSRVKVTVCEAVAVLPQASVAVHVLVTLTKQPLTISGCTVPVAVRPVEQLSVAEAVPKALFTSVGDALHVRAVDGASEIIGAIRSLVHITVLVAVTELPQPSEAVNVLICD
jgi:hypothetical protein